MYENNDEARYGTGPDAQEVEEGDVLRVYFDGQIIYEPREFEGEVVRIERDGEKTVFELSCDETVKCVKGIWFYMNTGTRIVEIVEN